MNSTAIYNRMLAGFLTAFFAPWVEQRFGVKLTEEQADGLVAAAPFVYHAFAGFAQKCANAFVMYFPPKVSQQAAEPPKA